MIDGLTFSKRAWAEYEYWQGEDKRTIKKINALIRDIARNGHFGIGHPEPLKYGLSGQWSREIDEKNRLVYRIRDDDGAIEIFQCKGHYDDK
jgi:toxin YoeB